MTPPRAVGSPGTRTSAPVSRPVAIGGVGGSGTRVAAQLVTALGFDLGSDRNEYGDNLVFTLLFKRPRRFRYERGMVASEDRQAVQAVRAFRDVMMHRGPNAANVAQLVRAAIDIGLGPVQTDVAIPHDRSSRRTRSAWARVRFSGAISSLRSATAARPWGWKEPNTFVFLPALCRELSGLRYVHVVRHGLDMAFSPNEGQVRNWGALYGVSDTAEDEMPLAQLRYWARANLTVSEYVSERTACLVVRYEDLTTRTGEEVERLCSFLGVTPTAEVEALVAKIRPSATAGRYVGQDYRPLLRAGGAEIAAALDRFGYDVAAP